MMPYFYVLLKKPIHAKLTYREETATYGDVLASVVGLLLLIGVHTLVALSFLHEYLLMLLVIFAIQGALVTVWLAIESSIAFWRLMRSKS